MVAPATGTVVGLVVAVVMTYQDWRVNPQGLFHDELGTSWGIVAETAASWFVPVALVVSALVAAVAAWISRRANRRDRVQRQSPAATKAPQ